MDSLFWRKVAMSFVRAFLATFVLGLLPVLESLSGDGDFDLSAARAALIALVVAGVAAGIRAVQALFTSIETPTTEELARRKAGTAY